MKFTDEWLVHTIEPLLPDQTIAALRQEATPASGSLWETLVQRKLIGDEQVLGALASRFRLPVADLSRVDAKLSQSVPEQVARRFNVVPVGQTDSYLEVATANPFDIDAEKMLAFATGREVRMLLGSPARIRERLDDLYRQGDVVNRLLEGIGGDFEVKQLKEEELEAASAEEASQRPIIKLVDMMLADGVSSRASDIHVEPIEGGVAVRYRIDGVLRQVMKIPRNAGLPLISRIKIMSGLDIADRLRPQDGRARVSVNGEAVDLRISTLPASLGEKVVIRILSQRATVLTLEALGMHPDERRVITDLLGNKEGIILVTGPTGSGKTTTLYSAIRMIQSEGVNIVTVEDPVEYRLGENIVQVQVHEKAGLTFSSALRSILRQDPDVVLVGEIRDAETAQIAVQASLTGHLVLEHAAHQRRAQRRHPSGGHGHGGLQDRLRAQGRRGPAAHAADLPRLPGPGHRAGAGARSAVHHRRSEALQGGRLRRVHHDRLSRALQHRRGAHDECRARAPHRKGHYGRPARRGRPGQRHAVPLGKRSPARPRRRIHGGGASPRHRSSAAGAESGGAGAPRAHQPGHGEPGGPASGASAPPPPVQSPASLDFMQDMELVGRRRLPWSAASGTCVLLVEDEEPLRRVMKDLLEREGYTVAEARDGVQALDEVDRRAPDVIILDLNLPGLDGYGVLQQLRSRPATRGIPVMVLTAKGDEDNEVRVFELGADDFITKPFRARALSARLEAVLGRHRA